MLVSTDAKLPIPRVTIFDSNGDVKAKKGFLPWDTNGYQSIERIKPRRITSKNNKYNMDIAKLLDYFMKLINKNSVTTSLSDGNTEKQFEPIDL